MADLYAAVYNPDVLSCLANLSSDEVFTPPEMANQVLDLLPKSLWSDPNARFLDPCSKTGVFLREIAKRLIRAQMPDFDQCMAVIDYKRANGEELSAVDEAYLSRLQPILDHIFHDQLYGIGITHLTSLMTRRSLYCSKWANGPYSVVEFDTAEGNVRFDSLQHTWIGEKGKEKCLFCGANKAKLEENRTSDETYAYEFIHTTKPGGIFSDMQFDVIIGNPPYQMNDGGNAASALPIYQKFVQQAQKLNPRFLTMIIPSRWFTGGRGLDAFRKDMLNDDRIRVLHDFPNSSDCFPGVEIKGGVCYFLWERDSHGDCMVYTHRGDSISYSKRPLLEEGMDTFIRTTNQITVLEKVRAFGEASLESILNAGRYFGFHTRVIWKGSTGELQTADGKSSYPIRKHPSGDFDTKVYIHGGECWIRNEDVKRNAAALDFYKVLLPRSGNPYGSIVGKPIICEKGACSSNTYVIAVPPAEFGTEECANNIADYICTRFVRYLVATRTFTQDMAPRAYSFVPMQDFTKKWTDADLYEKYGLNDEEIAEIEAMIPEMSR